MVVEEPSGGAEHALLRPVRDGNAFEETVERLLQFIRLGVVGTGQRLPAERDLAAALRVSRVTLREAIRALTDSGYVESRRGRYGGTFVAQSLPAAPGADLETVAQRMDRGLEDTLTMRQVLEAGAAEAAAGRTLTREQRKHLSDRLAETSEASLAEYRRRDSRLHLAISEITESPSLIAGVADARSRVNELLDAIPLLPANIGHSNEQHRVIVDRILAGDPRGAREAMAEHLAGTAALLRGFLA